jgi:hypothetical protein
MLINSVLDSLYNSTGRGYGGPGGLGALSEILGSGRMTDRPRGLFSGFDGLSRPRGPGLGFRDFGARQNTQALSGFGSFGRFGNRFSGARQLLR